MQLPSISQGELAQVIHQAGKQTSLVIKACNLCLVQRIDVIQDSLQVALQHAERGTQFVGYISHQVLAQLFRLL